MEICIYEVSKYVCMHACIYVYPPIPANVLSDKSDQESCRCFSQMYVVVYVCARETRIQQLAAYIHTYTNCPPTIR